MVFYNLFPVMVRNISINLQPPLIHGQAFLTGCCVALFKPQRYVEVLVVWGFFVRLKKFCLSLEIAIHSVGRPDSPALL